MTGSVVAIKAEELNRGAVSSPDQMLLGKVSGLHITPATGQPGASAKSESAAPPRSTLPMTRWWSLTEFPSQVTEEPAWVTPGFCESQ